MSELVTTQRHDAGPEGGSGFVSVITMDDGKANALSKQMIGDVRAAVTAAETDPDCVAMVIAGREGRFCAGFDLGVMQSGEREPIIDLVADGGELVRLLYGASVPIVAACTGHALAAGALMLLGADVRVGADGPFKVGLNEVAIGLTLPGWAYTITAQRLSNRHRQRSLATARLTDPAGAIDVGFLDGVVEPDQVVTGAIAEAAALASLDRRAYASMMRELRGETLVTMADQIAADRSG